MNAAINVSMVVTTSHPIAASTPVVSSRTMIPFAGAILASRSIRPRTNISKRGLEPVTYVTGRDLTKAGGVIILQPDGAQTARGNFITKGVPDMPSRIWTGLLVLGVVFALQPTASNAQSRIGSANSVKPEA
jgi:hypothetical protein